MQLPGSDNKAITHKYTTMSGNLDVGGGAASKIKAHAANNGFTGYAELKAQSSYDMIVNLQTAQTNGGWVYHKINNDTCLLVTGSGHVFKHFKQIAVQSDDKLKKHNNYRKCS